MLEKIFFLCLLAISEIFCLQVNVVDKDYVNVLVGFPQKKLKLMIDPMAPFTYIFEKIGSKTEKMLGEKIKFDNVFGSFEGVWKEDNFFLTDEKNFNFNLEYVLIEKKNTLLKCDGVIGLGYSPANPKGNIYDVLGTMKGVFNKIDKRLTYTTKNNTLFIGEFARKSGNNPYTVPLIEEKGNLFLNLTEIGFLTDFDRSKSLETIKVGDCAMVTLMPLIIAPKSRVEFLKKEYLSRLGGENAKIDFKKDPKEFWTDVYLNETNKKLSKTEMIFNRYGYKFNPYDDKKEKGYRAKIRFGDIQGHEFENWYIGLSTMDTDRVDFDFEKKEIKFYSINSYDVKKNRPHLLLEIIIYISIFAACLTTLLRVIFSKPKRKDIPKGQEMELL